MARQNRKGEYKFEQSYDPHRLSTSSKAPRPKARRGGILGWLQSVLSTTLWALGLAFILRTFLFQPFHIPSGSMEPNLTQGDYIITTKYPYGYGPYSAGPFTLPLHGNRIFGQSARRGDVAVFRDPSSKTNVVKRIVGLPGDVVQMRGGRLYLNNVAVPTQASAFATEMDSSGNPVAIDVLQEELPDGARYSVYDRIKEDRYDDTQAVSVPEGHYFALGDNRDGSADSRVPRVVGGIEMLPAGNLLGRAEFILLSVTEEFSIFNPLSWANMRSDRFFKDIP